MSSILSLKKSNYDYCHCYCEENVYRLAQKLIDEKVVEHAEKQLQIVFISNENKTIPVWKKSGSHVIWDYHVILFFKPKSTNDGSSKAEEVLVFDFDSDLEFPVSFDEYVKTCLHSKTKLDPQYQHYFRVIDQPSLVKTFSSDRSHMRLQNGNWSSPPPSWPCYLLPGINTNLFSDFVNMSNENGKGTIVNIEQLISTFGSSK
jgi:hypothetical protein